MNSRPFIKIESKCVDMIKRVKNILENKTKTKIEFSNNGEIRIEGDNLFDINLVKEFVKAVDLGFSTEDALKIITENYILFQIDVEEYSGKELNHKKRILARVIGRDGSAKRTIEEMTNTKVIVDNRRIWILGYPEDVSIAAEAFEHILSGRKHNTAYRKIRLKARWRKLERRYQTII